MNLVLLSAKDINAQGQAIISDERRFTHITQIHGAKPGDQLKVGMLDGAMGTGTVDAITENQIRLTLALGQTPPPALPLTLILGLPRPKMLKRIFQTIATLGIKDLYLVNSYCVEKSYWQTPFLHEDAIREQLILGLEQGCDTHLPRVHLKKRFKPFVEDELPAIIQGTNALVAHPYSNIPCPRMQQGPISLAVGPEGGFIAYEVALLETAGFTSVTLGERILRVETAIPFLVSRLF
jgi:16S rRNA (uracil1498-N3)-methyltransferase